MVGLIPLRGGSKSIPGKNIKLLAGKPLCLWVIEAAHKSGIFDRLVVSTDSEEIATVVRNAGLPVEIIKRPPEYATDSATTEAVMIHVASLIDFDIIATIQATSPLTRPEDFIAAYDIFNRENADSLLTCVRVKHFFWDDEGMPINYDPHHRPMRQNFNGTLMENGAFYFTRRAILEEYKCRLGGKICIYEMPAEMVTEIDEPSDWEKISSLVEKQKKGVLCA